MISDKALLFKQSPAKVRFHPFIGTRNAVITRQSGKIGRKSKRRTGDIFLHIRPEMQQKMKQPWHIRWTVMPMAVCFIRAFIRFLGGGSSVSFSRLQSDFPYTIFTPFRRGVVWNCMKLYSVCLCRKYAEIKNYRYLWSNIEI